MRGWQIRVRKYIIRVAGRVFVEDASTPYGSLETIGHVHFVNQRLTKQTKMRLKI